jgi:serine phosphatase RsbU (regulator of sigma subunit)
MLLLATAESAEVFRWTDENGQVHFSQRPPPRDAQRLQLPERAPGHTGSDEELMRRRERERRLLESYEYERSQERAREAREADARQEVAERCTRLQQYWRRLSHPGPVYIRRDDGERDYLSDAQREAEQARIRPAYVQACGREP